MHRTVTGLKALVMPSKIAERMMMNGSGPMNLHNSSETVCIPLRLYPKASSTPLKPIHSKIDLFTSYGTGSLAMAVVDRVGYYQLLTFSPLFTTACVDAARNIT